MQGQKLCCKAQPMEEQTAVEEERSNTKYKAIQTCGTEAGKKVVKLERKKDAIKLRDTLF